MDMKRLMEQAQQMQRKLKELEELAGAMVSSMK